MKHFLPSLFLLTAAAVCAADSVTPGNGLLYLGGFPNKIMVIDEATEKVTAEIRTKSGAPRNLQLSLDRARFYMTNATMEEIEIVDVATRRSIGHFKLSEGNKKVRIRSFAHDPKHRFLVLMTKTAEKQMDRWEIGPNVLQLYDLKEHKVTRAIPWPKGEEREFVSLMFSPDGKFLYFFGEDILAYDTTEWKEVDKWELSRPLEDGFGRINFGSMDTANEEPGYFTGLFQVQDAVNNRRIMGIARVNLSQKKVDFFALGPESGLSFTLAPGRKRAYGLHQEVGRYEFWAFDLENRRVASRKEFEGRPRMGLKTSTNGKVLYIFVAGNTIDLYDAATYQYLRTITLDSDMTTELHVTPR